MELDLIWVMAEAAPPLAPGEVHVWRVPLDVGPARLEALRVLLSPDELARAARFRFERDRAWYTACRGRLRELLGAYTGTPPGRLRFAYGVYGKPALPASPIAFNVSHAAGIGLIAVAEGARLGVDVEEMRDGVDFLEISRTVFAPGEQAVLRSLPEPEQKEAFYNAWTRKEAFIKAVGEGVAYGLDRFEVTLHPADPPAVLTFTDDPSASGRWRLVHLAPGEPFVGALAIEGKDWRVRLFG